MHHITNVQEIPLLFTEELCVRHKVSICTKQNYLDISVIQFNLLDMPKPGRAHTERVQEWDIWNDTSQMELAWALDSVHISV